MLDSFQCKTTLTVEHTTFQFYSLAKLANKYNLTHLPFAIKLFLENLLRHEDGSNVKQAEILQLIKWQAKAPPSQEISFMPARVLLQDFTGVPALVDLASMRSTLARLNLAADKINPAIPVELVIDHSVTVEEYGHAAALQKNVSEEMKRNQERYQFLRWGQQSFRNLKVVPPGNGIVHQVNLEYLARVVCQEEQLLFPDSVIGTDSHTPMINGLGVLGWGVGGIEAEAAMLGQPIRMLVPEIVGVELSGTLTPGVTATDLVLHLTALLRKHGVVGKIVEFYGAGLAQLSIADRATIANMAPEYGATSALFPIDQASLDYLQLTGRPASQIARVAAYYQAQGLFHTAATPVATYSSQLRLALPEVVPCLAGPKRPQDQIPLSQVAGKYCGQIKIAAITSCTNTSNPEVMLTAALLAKAAATLGLQSKPWVKTSLAPGSTTVTAYLQAAGLLQYFEQLGFYTVGYGCTTCIGNSGPLAAPIPDDAVAVLSGNRNFEGRIHPHIKQAFLASPPLVVAYALVGTIDFNFETTPLTQTADGQAVYLRDLWPSSALVRSTMATVLNAEVFQQAYRQIFTGSAAWEQLSKEQSELYPWPESSYIKPAPFLMEFRPELNVVAPLQAARALLVLGDSVTTDHISPAGSIQATSPAGIYLSSLGITAEAFNAYGARRGNFEVMVRGTFDNPKLRNQLTPGREGNWTMHIPSQTICTVYEAACRYQETNTPLIILAGKEYGTGSSRDWAAKGPKLLGVQVVIAESFERIHRTNLIGMGILPLEFTAGESIQTLQLSGTEQFSFALPVSITVGGQLTIITNTGKQFTVCIRLDTQQELAYYQHGGILPYVLRKRMIEEPTLV